MEHPIDQQSPLRGHQGHQAYRECHGNDVSKGEYHEQLSLFTGAAPAAGETDSAAAGRARIVKINPHLLAARRIARKMRRLPDRSEAETRAGLAICAQLKAYLSDSPPT